MATHRIYYDDSFARDFEAKVLTCEPCVHGTTPAWEVVLDETALYPTSGGQPCDRGKLGDANVLDVRDDGDEIMHIVDRELRPGPVHGCVDWLAPLRSHAAAHRPALALGNVSRAIRPPHGFISSWRGAEFDRSSRCRTDARNSRRRGARGEPHHFRRSPINVRYGTQEQLAQMGVRKEVDRTGILRAIEIEGADLQPCGGTHVRRTAQIGMLLVRRCTKMRQDWRVEFVCGARSERLARNDFRLIARAAAKLECAPDDLADAAARVVAERDANFKEVRSLLQRLAEIGSGSGIAIRQLQRVVYSDSSFEHSTRIPNRIIWDFSRRNSRRRKAL